MKKTRIRVAVDILLYVAMCFLAGTGLLIHYRLVPGFRGGHGLSLFGFTRHEWGVVHLWIAILLLVLVMVHLALNLDFIKNTIARKKTWVLTGLGLTGLLIVLFFLLAPIERTGEDQEDDGRRHKGRTTVSSVSLSAPFPGQDAMGNRGGARRRAPPRPGAWRSMPVDAIRC